MVFSFDMGLIQQGARLRRSPYFEATLKYGCRAYTVYNHTFLPGYYDDPVNEYWHLLNHVAIWDVGVERQVEITGPDADILAELVTPRDLSNCKVGQGKYVTIGAPDGGIINDPVLIHLAENTWWFSLADSDALLYCLGVGARSGLDVKIREPDVWPMQVQGPKSKPLIADLFGGDVAEMRYYNFKEANLHGIPLIVTRTGWSGEVGYELYLRDSSRGLKLWEEIMRAGKKYEIRPTGPSDIRRIEAGMLNFGADMTIENNPYEVGLDWIVDLDKKAEFIGRESLRRIKEERVSRNLVGVEIHGAAIEFNQTKWDVSADGKRVGQVTSAIHSPRLRKNIGYAVLPVELSKVGSRLTVVTPWGNREATVARKPFIDPKKEIPKS